MIEYRLADFLDLNSIQTMADSHYRATGMPLGLIDAIDGSVLVGAGWQDICILFHRINPVTNKRCLESDNYIKDHLVEGKACSYKCKNGLTDIGVPIFAGGQHLATLFLGQFFYEDETPDRAFFINQAEEFGFRLDEYLVALDSVPRFSHEKVNYILEYNMALGRFLSELADQSLHKAESEQKIRENEHFIQTLMDAILNPIFSKDVNGVYKSCNAAFEAYLGLTQQQIVGKTVYELAPPELAGRYHEMDMALLQQGGGQVYESTVRYADGSLHDVIFNKATYNNADGSLGGIVGVIIDITERKRSEEALRHSQITLQKAQETAHLGIWEWDLLRDKLMWTDELYRIHGLKPGAVALAAPGFDMVHPDDRGICQECINQLLSGVIIPFMEYRIVKPDGEVRHIYSSAELFRGTDEKPERILGIAYDITEHKKLEEQLRQAQKMEAIGTLAGGVAHDFNNILTAIIGYASLLMIRMSEDNSLRGYVEEILGASERAATLTGSLLAFSRKQVINLKPINLNEIVKGINRLLKRVIGEDIEFRSLLCREKLVVLADNGQIEQVLMNLATNARDSMPNGGILTIATELLVINGGHGYMEPGNYAALSVSDNGQGMDEATRQRIFEPFFTTKETGKGTGLGLSMVYGIVKQHNGEIKVYSELGGGTIFRVYFKLLDESVENAKIMPATPVTGGTETILIAEDDVAVRQFFKGVLEEYGYKVIVAIDGEDAVAKYIENHGSIQLLIFDLIMPKKNGKDAYDEIIKFGATVPVIFSSGYTADVIHQKGIVEDGISLITKPVSPYVMLSKIREVLSTHKTDEI